MKNCSTCAHSADAAKDKMPGWLTCALAERWNFRPPQAECSFVASRWQEKPEVKK